MRDLAKLQESVWERIRAAGAARRGGALATLGRIADDMDSRYEEWKQALENLNADGAAAPIAFRPPRSDRLHTNSGGDANVDVTGKSLYGVHLFGERLSLGTFKELLLATIAALHARHRKDFESVAVGVRGHRSYFSPRADELRTARRINGSNLYVETNLNARLIVEICYRLLSAFGHSRADLRLELSAARTRAQRNA